MNAQAAPNFRVVLPGGLASFPRCPKAWLRDDAGDSQTMIKDWSRLKQLGLPPAEGGTLDQDPRFLSAVDIIEEEMAREAPKGRK